MKNVSDGLLSIINGEYQNKNENEIKGVPANIKIVLVDVPDRRI